MNTYDKKLVGVGGLRITQRQVAPAVIKGRQIDTKLLSNSSVERISASLNDGQKATLTSTITANVSGFRVGVMPYMVQVYIGSAATENILSSGSSVDTTKYTIDRWFVPQISGGTDGDNVVAKTTVANNSGITQTVIFDVQSRHIISGGSPATVS